MNSCLTLSESDPTQVKEVSVQIQFRLRPQAAIVLTWNRTWDICWKNRQKFKAIYLLWHKVIHCFTKCLISNT